MGVNITIEDNMLNDNGTCIRNLNTDSLGASCNNININISKNSISGNACIVDNITNQLPSDTQKLVLGLKAELEQLKAEHQQDSNRIEQIIKGLDANMPQKNIINQIIKGADFLLQSTISGIIGNSAYSLLQTILLL